MRLYGFPYNLEIDVAVVMDNAVTHAGDLVEWDAGKLRARLGREPGRRLPGDQEPSEDRVSSRRARCPEGTLPA